MGGSRVYVGVDVHKNFSFVCVMKENGGTILYNCPVEKIIVEDGEAKGVVLSEDAVFPGKVIKAKKAIVSNLSAPLTLQLIGEDVMKSVDPELASRMKYWKMDGVSPVTTFYLLKGLPKWKSEIFDPDIKITWEPYRAWDSLEQAEKHFVYYANEKIDKIVGNVAEVFITAATDKTQITPEGYCTLAFEQELPVHLRRYGGIQKWDDPDFKKMIMDRHTEVLDELAVGFKHQIIKKGIYTPLDEWRQNPSAIYGNEMGGECGGDQWYLGRMPYRMPIKGLYMSNSVWPIGYTCLGSGYNAASVVAEDLGIRDQPWWTHEPAGWFFKNFDRLVPG